MGWELSAFGLSLVLLGLALCSLGAGALRGPEGRELAPTTVAAGLLVTVGLLVGIVGLQTLRVDLGTSLVLTKLFVAVLALVPLLWLRYVCLYTGRPEWFTGRPAALTGAVGVAIVLAAATNEAHWLFWRSVGAVEGPLSTVATTPGPLFDVYLIYLVLPIAVALVLLAGIAMSARGLLRAQAYALFAVTLAPTISTGAYLTGRTDGAALGLVGLAVLVAAVGVMVGLVRYRWLEITPISRDRVVDVMSDATLVVSEGGAVLDHNPRAAALLCGDPEGDFVGRPLVDLAPRLVTDVIGSDERHVETALRTAEGSRRFEVTASPAGQSGGTVLLLHDVTERAALADDLTHRRGTMERLVAIARELSAAERSDEIYDRATVAAVDLLGADHCRIVGGSEWTTLSTTAETSPFGDVLSTAIARQVAMAGRPHVIEDLSIRGGSVAADRATGSPGTSPVAPTSPAPESPGSAPSSPGVNGSSPGIDEPTAPKSGPVSPVAEPHSTPGESRAVDDARRSADGGQQAPAVLEETFSSLVSVPIEGIGVIQAFCRRPEAFDDDDVETLSLLAAHVSTSAERVESERALRAERDRLEEFASVLSHDLRNPLSVATGYLELSREDPSTEHFDRIERAHERMDDLIDDLLRLARDGEIIGETSTVRVENVVEEAWKLAEAPHSTLRVEDELGLVDADETRLIELFGNLFRNAVEHGAGADGGVVVTVTRDGDRLVVADDGPGIDPSLHDRVFERGVSGAPDGTGFGLAIVRDVANAHGWSVTAEESASGGAAFVLSGLR